MVKVLRALPGEERKLELKPWLYRIAHNESVELLRRRRLTRPLDVELASSGAGLAEEAMMRDRLRQLIADLDQLPERQRECLVMRELAGLDFAEIGAALGTSASVARQTVYEARLSLRQMGEGREMSCDAVSRALSDGDGRVLRRRDVRAHLRACADCRAFRDEISARRKDFAAFSPLPAVAAAGLLQGLLGSASGGSSGGLAAALGGGAAKSVGVSTALKGAATVAVVTAIGVSAADRGGLIDTPLPGGNGSPRESRAQVRGSGGRPTHAAEAGTVAGRHSAQTQGAAGHAAAAGEDAANGRTGVSRARGAEQGAGTPAAGDSSPGTAASENGNGHGHEHPHGRGHEKSHPTPAAQGQQSAGGPGGKQGAAGAKGPPHQAKPPPPAPPPAPR